MKQQILQAKMCFKIGILLIVAVLSIPQNVMPDMSHVPTDLMGPASKQFYF